MSDVVVVLTGDCNAYITRVQVFDEEAFRQYEQDAWEDRYDEDSDRPPSRWGKWGEIEAATDRLDTEFGECTHFVKCVRLYPGDALYVHYNEQSPTGGRSMCVVIPKGFDVDAFVKGVFMHTPGTRGGDDDDDDDSGGGVGSDDDSGESLANETTPVGPLDWSGNTHYNCYKPEHDCPYWHENRLSADKGPTLLDISGITESVDASPHSTHFLWRLPVAD